MIFPKSLRTAVQGAFAHCENLKTASLNDGLEVLGTEDKVTLTGVFSGSALERVELPSTLKRIQNCTFYECKNLKHISLPSSLESIGAFCFARSCLEEITLPGNVTRVGATAFMWCK